MAVTKAMMVEWLGEVPDGAEIGIEVGQRGELDLIAFSGEDDQHILVVGGIPEDRKKVNPQSNGKQH